MSAVIESEDQDELEQGIFVSVNGTDALDNPIHTSMPAHWGLGPDHLASLTAAFSSPGLAPNDFFVRSCVPYRKVEGAIVRYLSEEVFTKNSIGSSIAPLAAEKVKFLPFDHQRVFIAEHTSGATISHTVGFGRPLVSDNGPPQDY